MGNVNTAYTSLIGRLEKATGPDRLLDREIARAGGWKDYSDKSGEWWINPADGQHTRPEPSFTRSLDAALTLVPPEANCHGYEVENKGRVEAFVSRNYVREGHWCKVGWHDSSPAIALCIAALKARMAVAP